MRVVTKRKDFITASKFIKTPLKSQCNILQKSQRNKYTANIAENNFRADKLLIIS